MPPTFSTIDRTSGQTWDSFGFSLYSLKSSALDHSAYIPFRGAYLVSLWFSFMFSLNSSALVTPQPFKIFSLILFNHMHNSFLYTRTKILNQLGTKSKLEPRPFFLSKTIFRRRFVFHDRRHFLVFSRFLVFVSARVIFLSRDPNFGSQRSGREEKSRTRRVHVAN